MNRKRDMKRRKGDSSSPLPVTSSPLPEPGTMSDPGPGYIHVYTGDGKGKTTASLGLALRAVGTGLKVLVLQFLKGPEMTGERRAAQRLSPELTIRPLGRDGMLAPGDITAEDRVLAGEAVREAEREMAGGRWDVLILDELNTACALGLVEEERGLEMMDGKPDNLELVLTGRGAPEPVMARADLVTEMREVKHYFREGVSAREGIEK